MLSTRISLANGLLRETLQVAGQRGYSQFGQVGSRVTYVLAVKIFSVPLRLINLCLVILVTNLCNCIDYITQLKNLYFLFPGASSSSTNCRSEIWTL